MCIMPTDLMQNSYSRSLLFLLFSGLIMPAERDVSMDCKGRDGTVNEDEDDELFVVYWIGLLPSDVSLLAFSHTYSYKNTYTAYYR